mgnify:CR=1 FL=1
MFTKSLSPFNTLKTPFGRPASENNSANFNAHDGFFSDGFRSDKDGNIWTSAGKGIKCFDPNNKLIGQILLPELVSNLEFGGKEGNILYVTATSSLYKMELNQIGAKFK